MSLKQRAHGSELYGYPIPRRPITFDLRQEPGAGKPHARICAGGEEQSSSLPRPWIVRRNGLLTTPSSPCFSATRNNALAVIERFGMQQRRASRTGSQGPAVQRPLPQIHTCSSVGFAERRNSGQKSAMPATLLATISPSRPAAEN